jgi:hypothetical protein
VPARFPTDLFAACNVARVKNNCAPVALSQPLVDAAGYAAEWIVHARKHKLPGFQFHLTQTKWLYGRNPDLRWDLLHATFGETLPEQLGIYDVARLCEFSGESRDIIGVANKTPANAVAGWLASTGTDGTGGHRSVLLWAAATWGGCAKEGGGQGAIVVAVFGNSF